MLKDKTGKSLSSTEVMKKGFNRVENILLELEVYLLHMMGCVPSHLVRRLFYRMGGIQIGKGSTIHMHARFYNPHNISIGKDSIIGEGVVLDGRAKLAIGDHVDIASDVMIYNSQHNIHAEHFAAEEGVQEEAVTIHDYVFIGPRAIILPGITIGKGAVVGAGAVVTKDVEEGEIVGGIPAKVIGTRDTSNLHYILGRARWFR